MSSSNLGVEQMQFRFQTWRPSRMPSALRMDEALDLVGQKLHPETWGRHPDFAALPLFFRSGRTKIYKLERDGKKGFKRVDIDNPTESMFQLAEQFKLVRRSLREAIRSGEVSASAVNSEGRKQPLKDAELTVRSTSIFGAGTVKRFGRRLRVWVNRTEFETWLAKTFRQKRVLTTSEFEHCVGQLEQVLRSGGMKSLNENNIREFIQQRYFVDPPKKVVDDVKGRLPGLKGGRPSKRQWKKTLADLLKASN